MTGSINRPPQMLEALTYHPRDQVRRPRRRGIRRKTVGSWIFLFVCVAYFALPLIGTLLFSLRARPMLSAWTDMINDPQVWSSLGYSFIIGILTIVVSIGLLVPTAFWVRLRLPRLRPFVELVTLLHGTFAPYHFRESLEGGTLSFDYRLHEGPSSNGAAATALPFLSRSRCDSGRLVPQARGAPGSRPPSRARFH